MALIVGASPSSAEMGKISVGSRPNAFDLRRFLAAKVARATLSRTLASPTLSVSLGLTVPDCLATFSRTLASHRL
jgi:hypothetical protein